MAQTLKPIISPLRRTLRFAWQGSEDDRQAIVFEMLDRLFEESMKPKFATFHYRSHKNTLQHLNRMREESKA